MDYHFPPIGILSSPFKEKFGVPRQSLMVSEATGILKLRDEHTFLPALTHLSEFSHIWLIFAFHRNGSSWHPLIDTPRFEHGKKVGVFATRSPHRPNPLGMSVVKLDRIDFDAEGGVEIHLSGLDLLDGTPVLDIKPYIPYADHVHDANTGWLIDSVPTYPVSFSPQSCAALDTLSQQYPNLSQLIEQMLALDPRPTSQKRAFPIADAVTEGKPFAFRVMDVDVRWCVQGDFLHVTEVIQLQR